MQPSIPFLFRFYCLFQLLLIIFAVSSAEAQSVNKNVPVFSFFSGVEAKANVLDSTRSTAPDFAAVTARMGVKAATERHAGVLEVNLNNGGLWGLKEADILYHILPGRTTVVLGRTRPGGANNYGADPRNGTLTFNVLDGLGFTQRIPLKANQSVTLSAYAGNEFAQAETNGFGLFKNSTTLAYVACAQLNLKQIEAFAGWGYQSNKYTPGLLATDNGTLQSLSQFELSAAFLWKSLQIGGWYGVQGATARQTATWTNGRPTPTADPLLPSRSTSVMGFGINGDTSFTKLKDLVNPGDRLKYGLSVDLSNVVRESGNASHPDIMTISVSGGYSDGPFDATAALALRSAQENVLTDSSGNNNKSAQIVYLKASYALNAP